MLPVAFSLFGHPVSTYGLFFSLAHLVGIAAVLFLLRSRGRPPEPYVDLLFAVLSSAIVGGRVWYVLEFSAEFRHPGEWLYFWKGGLSVFGAFLGALAAFALFLRMRKLPLWETADLFAPVLALSLGLVRIGCFSAGCCFGGPTDLPWGIHPISSLTPTWLASEAIHPTQLYEAIFLFSASAFFFHCARKNEAPSGTLATGFFALYGLYRLLTNPLRGDLVPWIGAWSSSDLGAALLFLVSLALFTWRWKRARFARRKIPISLP